jgi:hypothetical protein
MRLHAAATTVRRASPAASTVRPARWCRRRSIELIAVLHIEGVPGTTRELFSLRSLPRGSQGGCHMRKAASK